MRKLVCNLKAQTGLLQKVTIGHSCFLTVLDQKRTHRTACSEGVADFLSFFGLQLFFGKPTLINSGGFTETFTNYMISFLQSPKHFKYLIFPHNGSEQ